MKGLFAILFSFLLAGMQTVSPSWAGQLPGSAAVGKPRCACTKCETSCCPLPANRSAAPVPAAPSQSRPQVDWQALHVVVCPVATLATPVEQKFPASVFFSPGAAVPLYEWNCSYLI